MPQFTFILPCLNEENTIEYCINEIKKSIEDNHLDAEILVSDNGSTDKSREIAESLGARVCICEEKGYGNALINGTKNANGKYCVMGDCDGSYDFYNIKQFIEKLDEGYEMVVGNRYKGGIEKNAMPISHYFGVKFLSGYANLFFQTPIKDFHCGLRFYDTEKIKNIKLSCPGMEYASEMIIKAKINGIKMCEVATILRKDKRGHGAHLKTIRDGFRHLFFITHAFIFQRSYIVNKTSKTKVNN